VIGLKIASIVKGFEFKKSFFFKFSIFCEYYTQLLAGGTINYLKFVIQMG
jgi:hypothetical protein